MPRKKKDKPQPPPYPTPPPERPGGGIRIETGNFTVSFE
jgi:hypothetical protein